MVSKFKEINDKYVNYQIEVNEYYSECMDFIDDMVNGLAEFLNCNRSDLFFGPNLKRFNESVNNEMELIKALEFEDDAYLHFGVGIQLYGHDYGVVNRRQYTQFAIKKIDDKFSVIVNEDEFSVHKGDKEEIKEIFISYFNQMINYFKESSLKDFIKEGIKGTTEHYIY